MNSEVVCTTSTNSGTESTVDVEITSGGASFQGAVSYSYSSTKTPVTTTVSPASATNGDTISITGSNLGGATKVLVGSTECVISAQTSTTISCALGFNVGGFDYPIKVLTSDGFRTKMFKYLTSSLLYS